ncbi:MAG TPA: hypothetical protein VEO54_13940 [Thermoanaerobaculia bacterium]|nr:hypothetical protein [Thermoanaerobaculia bacterium]
MSDPIEAAEFIEVLEKVQARIDGYRPLTNEEIITIRKAASLDPEWVEQAVHMLSSSEMLQQAIGTTHQELIAEIVNERAWQTVERRLYALLKGVSAGNLVRRHRIGLKALQIYGIARHLIRQPEHNHLLSYVERLQQMNKLGKRKKKET